MESGASAEIAITGNEGLVGISLFMGGESTPRRAVVQSTGNGYRLKASVLIKVVDRAKLEKRVCECSAVVKKEFDRLLPYKIHDLPNTTAQPFPSS
jgi:hypothetical protein